MMNDKEAIEDIYKRYEKAKNTNDVFFKQKIKMYSPTLKYAAVLLGIVLLSSSITIGNNFFNYTSKSNVGYLDKNLYTDIANNKLQNVNMDYCNSNGIGVKVSNILIDDQKIYLVFDFKFDEPLEENVNLLELPDMIITNEQNEVVYCRSYKQYIKHCNDNNLKYLSNNKPDPNYHSQFIEKNQSNIKTLLILSNNSNYTNIKNLNIKFNTILLSNNLKIEENDTYNSMQEDGEWNLDLVLKEK